MIKSLCRLLLLACCILLPTYTMANDKLPDYYENAKAAIDKLLARGDDTKAFTDDILVAQNYLRNAESEYRKNLSWGKLEKNAEPTVRYYAGMAELHAAVVTSRLGKLDQDKERQRLERSINDTKAKVKVFDDKNIEIARQIKEKEAFISELTTKKREIGSLNEELGRLKTDKDAQEAVLSAKITALTGDLAAKGSAIALLERQLAEKSKSLDTLTASHKRTSDELQALTAQKGAEFVDVQAKLRQSERFRELVGDAAKSAVMLRFTDNRLTMLFPRSQFFKVSNKGVTLLPEATATLAGIAALLQKYPDYRAQISVHGSGKPAKQEDAKATEQMAMQLKDHLVTKGQVAAGTIEASGAGSGSPLFPGDAAPANRRVEVTLQPAATP